MRVYFNHDSLKRASTVQFPALLKELALLGKEMHREQVTFCVDRDVCNQQVNGQTLYQHLVGAGQDEAHVAVKSLFDLGPWYDLRGVVPGLQIDPAVQGGGFGEQLLHTCYQDRTEYVQSLVGDQLLANDFYKFTHVLQNDHQLHHFRGQNCFLTYLQGQIKFADIYEVFSRIEQQSTAIVFLDDARSSAKKHLFGSLKVVYESLLALERVELPLTVERTDEVARILAYREATGLEISRESGETLKSKIRKRRRMFTIPGLGDRLFEWHIKIDGNHTRIHYFVDTGNKKVYIGHCGEHLPIASDRS